MKTKVFILLVQFNQLLFFPLFSFSNFIVLVYIRDVIQFKFILFFFNLVDSMGKMINSS